MFGISLGEIFLIIIIFFLFVPPKYWGKILKKIGYLTGKYTHEISEIKKFINSNLNTKNK